MTGHQMRKEANEINFDKWVEGSRATKKKNSRRENIKHEKLMNIAYAAKDDFWKALLTRAACGKFPANFSIEGSMLVKKRATKPLTVGIPDDVDEAYEVCVAFFKQNGGIFSEEDRRLDETRKSSKVIESWKKAPRAVRENLLNEFYENEKRVNHLSDAETRQLVAIVTQTLTLQKHIQSCDIVIENNYIAEITRIQWDPEERMYRFIPKKNTRAKKAVAPTSCVGICNLGECDLPTPKILSHIKDIMKTDAKNRSEKTEQADTRTSGMT